MIEIIYNKEKDKTVGNEEYFCIPRNIRQMGDVPKEQKIYVEDYVYTYLTSDWKNTEIKSKLAILLGKNNRKDGISYIFVRSAVTIDDLFVTRDNIPLTDSVWGVVHEEMKKYFPGQDIVGWYLSVPDGSVGITDAIIKIHLKHFDGNDKIFLQADPYERESCFYLYRNNQMVKVEGYYIFYEKNDLMQEYMLTKQPETIGDYSGKAQDRAVQDFRKIISRKQEERTERKSGFSTWTVAACTGIVAVSLGVSAFWLLQREDANGDVEYISAEETTSVIEEFVNEDSEEPEMVLLTPEATESPEELERSEEPQITDVPQQQEEPQPDSDETSISVYTKYTVRAGDTISKISMRYYGDFSKIAEICKINNMLEEDVIYPGQTILLP